MAMNVSDAEAGSVLDLGDRLEARLERIIEHDRREVWRMLTDPGALANWLAPAAIDARKGVGGLGRASRNAARGAGGRADPLSGRSFPRGAPLLRRTAAALKEGAWP